MGLVFPGFAIFAYPGSRLSFLDPGVRPEYSVYSFVRPGWFISHAQVSGLNVSYSASLSLHVGSIFFISSLILTFLTRVDFHHLILICPHKIENFLVFISSSQLYIFLIILRLLIFVSSVSIIYNNNNNNNNSLDCFDIAHSERTEQLIQFDNSIPHSA